MTRAGPNERTMTVAEGKPHQAAANFPESDQPGSTSCDEALTYGVLRRQSTPTGGRRA